MNRQYFSMEKRENEATINIYGDITSWEDQAKNLAQRLDELTDVSKINVYVNSYGGEVAEGLAIYNALRRHKAKVVTHCDGFACSIASVVFMAGDERIMSDSSLLMIHNAWTISMGNATQLRKEADDLDKITQASVTAYKAHSTLSEEEIKALMDAESWITPEEALEYGFATAVERVETENASQNAKQSLLGIVKAYREMLEALEAKDEADEETDEQNEETDEENPPKPETDEDEPTDDDENGENRAKNAPKTDDAEETDETDGETEDGENKPKKPAEKLSGIFNAILKI